MILYRTSWNMHQTYRWSSFECWVDEKVHSYAIIPLLSLYIYIRHENSPPFPPSIRPSVEGGRGELRTVGLHDELTSNGGVPHLACKSFPSFLPNKLMAIHKASPPHSSVTSISYKVGTHVLIAPSHARHVDESPPFIHPPFHDKATSLSC